MATIKPPDLGTKGWSGLFMSFPIKFAVLAELIHFFVRNRVTKKLNSRIIPDRISSSKSMVMKSMKPARLVEKKGVTADSKVKKVNTAIFICLTYVSVNGVFPFYLFKQHLYA